MKITPNQGLMLLALGLTLIWIHFHPLHSEDRPINPVWQECFDSCYQGINARYSPCVHYCDLQANP